MKNMLQASEEKKKFQVIVERAGFEEWHLSWVFKVVKISVDVYILCKDMMIS